MDKAALLRAYRDCHYDVRLASGARCTLRIGEPAPPALAGWLAGAATGAFITACNPYSVAQSLARNRAAQRDLLAQLRALGARWLPGVGRIPGQPWREPSLFVAGLDRDTIDTLARRHSQNAVVLVHGNAAAHLRCYGAGWPAP